MVDDGISGRSPLIKDRFVYEERGERKVMLLSLVLLYNLRARFVGLNQIQTTFMPHITVKGNILLSEVEGISN